MAFLKVFVVITVCIAICGAMDMIIGTSVNNTLAYTENVKLSSVPFSTRVKNVWYNSNDTMKMIKGISAIDINKSDARATVTSGGVGFTYVNIKIKSSRGDGLNYLIQIFV